MRTYFVINFIFFCLFSFNISAADYGANSNNNIVKKKKIIISRDRVVEILDSIDSKIVDGDVNGKKISYGIYNLFAYQIKDWLKKPWIELDTRIAKSWYIDIYNTFVRMGKLKRSLERMELRHKDKTDVYKFQREKFIAEYKHFKELQAKPTKLTKTRYRELVKAKRAWEKKERIKAAKARALARAKKHSKR